jgi:DNA mismatch endonuclease (patch repair protein)
MASKWESTDAGRHLKGRQKVNTEPEIMLRRELHRAGARFRLHVRLVRGCTPDILLPGRHLAVFVDGCWWHSCPQHGRKTPFTGPNAELWSEKMRRNRERDERATALAQDLGWKVVRVWECDVRKDAAAAAQKTLAQSGRHSHDPASEHPQPVTTRRPS